jgi:hypothetical protein
MKTKSRGRWCIISTIKRNILWSSGSHASPFWKGILYDAHALKFGYRWVPRDGRTIQFWEDIWFGTALLGTQFWDLYVLYNEKTKTITDVWVGES